MAPVRFPSLHDDLVLAGEVHYFRLDRADWADRLDDALDLGLTAVATYVPWLVHETADGGVDVTGRTRPELDVGAFLDLCGERGLAVVARPGPFVMAELKHEGLGQRLLREHPEVTRVGEMADELDLTERSLQRLVEQRLGLSPKWLVQRRRLHDAVEALKAGSTSLADVAAGLGYTDQAHFTHDFRTMTGVTPG